ncbi:flagellar protein FlgN [Desulfotomaculum sp. 1211_IL3151]|uniref:flagellar protein FlgN n=1 Tax=Desulfotomaculum sp. 1211_IL3151 TaxID=3084055 RepID=UPI002FD8A5DC
MESLFFNLKDLLRELNNELNKMLQATEQHNQALRANDLDAIKEILKELALVSRQIKILDAQRETVQTALEEGLKLPKGTTLTRTIAHAPQHLVQDLNRAAESLREITATIQNLVEINAILTKQAMNFNEVLLKTIKPIKSTYNPTGQTTDNTPATSILNKTI